MVATTKQGAKGTPPQIPLQMIEWVQLISFHQHILENVFQYQDTDVNLKTHFRGRIPELCLGLRREESDDMELFYTIQC